MITHPDVQIIPPYFLSAIHRVVKVDGQKTLELVWTVESYEAASNTTPQDYGTPHEFSQVHTTQQHWQPKINQQAELDKLELPQYEVPELAPCTSWGTHAHYHPQSCGHVQVTRAHPFCCRQLCSNATMENVSQHFRYYSTTQCRARLDTFL